MSVTLTVSEKTYKNLKELARLRGFQTIEQFLEKDKRLFERRKELEQRRKLGKEIAEIREKIFQEQGLMADSIELVREDRQR